MSKKEDARQTVRFLHQQEVSIREISRRSGVSRNTVRRLIRDDMVPSTPARDSQLVEQIKHAYNNCQGNAVRIVEEMKARYDTTISYSTLTRIIREEELRTPPRRAGHYEHAPANEMQHDTSPHRIIIGESKVVAQCASLVFPYSRKLYIQYYANFTRFEAKAFLDDALHFFDGACTRCVIDNTSVVLASGSGADAVITPEMAAFGRIYGFHFIAHSVGNPNRKAHVERAFHYVEHNFLAGRAFGDWNDLNQQAKAWCEQVANAKVKRSLGMSPEAAFIMEKPHLLRLPEVAPPVYQSMERIVSVEGYVNLDSNRYSVPENLIGKQVTVHKHLLRVVILFQHKSVAEHDRFIDKRGKTQTEPSHHQPLHRQQRRATACDEEKLLRGQNSTLDGYLNGLKKRAPGRGVTRLRKLLNLHRTYPESTFMAAITQALEYGMYDLNRLEQMILDSAAGDIFQLDGNE